MSREKSLFKNTLILAFGTIMPKFSSLITLPIITANLSKSDYGIYDLINTLAIFFLPLATLKIETAAFRYLIEVRDDDKEKKLIISNILAFIIGVSSIALLIPFIALKNISPSIRILICIFFFVDTLISATRQVARGLSKNKIYSNSAVINSLLNLALVIVFISWKNCGLKGILIASIIPLVVSLLYLIIACDMVKYVDFKLINKGKLRELINYSLPMVPNSMSSWIMNLSDRLVVTWILGVEVNAIYAISNKLPSLFTMMQGTFSLAWQENASISNNDKDVNEYYNNMFESMFSILCGVMAILIATTPIIFKILVHGNYYNAYNQIPILYMSVFFASIASFFAGIYIAQKDTKSVGVSTSIAAIVNLVVNLSLIWSIKLYAASISTLVSYIVLTIYRMYDIRKLQKFKYNYRMMFFGIIVLSVMCIFNVKKNFYFDIANIILGCIFALLINREFIKNIFINSSKKYFKKGAVN